MPARRRPYHRVDLETQLLDAASRLLADGGLEALSLRELGRAVGVSRTAAYHYFPDKATLLARVGERGFTVLLEQLHRVADPTLPIAEQLVRGLEAYVACACDDPARFRVMFGNVLVRDLVRSVSPTAPAHAFSSDAAAAAFRALLSPLEDAHARGELGDVSPLVAGHAFWAFAHGVAALAIGDNLKPSSLAPSLLREGVLAMLAGFRARSPQRGAAIAREHASASGASGVP